MTLDYNVLKESGRYFLTKENCNEILKNQKVVKKIKRLLNRVGKMEQMEYGYMSWQDEIEDILEGKK